MKASINWLNYENKEYRRLFYYTSPDHILENLRGGIIKVSNFSQCNDLFELASIDLRNSDTRETHRRWVSDTSNKVGLICLSENWRNTLMWGHYASNGEGLCLVLDCKQIYLQEVEYISRRDALPSGTKLPDRDDANFRQFCSKKSSHWAYEREQRFFVDFNSGNSNLKKTGDMNFLRLGDSIRLAGVINGPRPKLGMSEILCAARKEIPYLQCRPAFREFFMVAQQSTSIWRA